MTTRTRPALSLRDAQAVVRAAKDKMRALAKEVTIMERAMTTLYRRYWAVEQAVEDAQERVLTFQRKETTA